MSVSERFVSREEFNNSIADEAAQSCVDWSDPERRKEALRYILKQIWNEARKEALEEAADTFEQEYIKHEGVMGAIRGLEAIRSLAAAAAPSLHKEGAGGEPTIAKKLQGVVNKWLAEAERLHNLTPDERERDSRRNGLLEAVADVVAFTAEHDCGARAARPAEKEPKG